MVKFLIFYFNELLSVLAKKKHCIVQSLKFHSLLVKLYMLSFSGFNSRTEKF